MSMSQNNQKAFPLKPGLLGLGGVALALPASMLLLYVFSSIGWDVFTASLVLAGVNVVVAMTALVMACMVAPQGAMAVTVAFLAGGMARFVANLLAVVLLAVVMQVSYAWIVGLLALAYLPVLVMETAIVGRHLWQQDRGEMTNYTEAVA